MHSAPWQAAWGPILQDSAHVPASCSSSHHVPRSRAAGQGQIGRKEHSTIQGDRRGAGQLCPRAPRSRSLCSLPPPPTGAGQYDGSGGRGSFRMTVILEGRNGQAAGPIPRQERDSDEPASGGTESWMPRDSWLPHPRWPPRRSRYFAQELCPRCLLCAKQSTKCFMNKD